MASTPLNANAAKLLSAEVTDRLVAAALLTVSAEIHRFNGKQQNLSVTEDEIKQNILELFNRFLKP